MSCLLLYILLMQVVDANKWSTVSSVGHTFICAYQRASDGSLDSLCKGIGVGTGGARGAMAPPVFGAPKAPLYCFQF